MHTIEICVGSSCFVKGSNELVEKLKKYLEENHLEDKVQLKGAFCMGQCAKGLGVRVDGKLLEGVTLANAIDLIEIELNSL
ncbi:(2Fe-2S) ferredoxin domain-containing protein [uncultured Traorella sp.]|uniref:(2Fe-2S) ferredoxin domain-containing protein n=1 Tax=uncultured Traorella sp. TaxID=1929048 RepID=UPI0025D680EF|nr:(2Fe-2S) ferredoxin domain-containing protein [uncultured Traorella sp.]